MENTKQLHRFIGLCGLDGDCFMGRSKKRSKIGSSSSNGGAEDMLDMADNSDISYPVKDAIDALRKAMEAGFDGLP